MRADLEAAMGRVITNHSARAEFVQDPRGYATRQGLSPTEVDAMVEMTTDLTALTPSFVNKRIRTLRGPAGRTMTLLGERARPFMREYINGHPPVELVQRDQGLFLDFIAERVAELRDDIPNGPLLCDLARFERMRHAAFEAPQSWPVVRVPEQRADLTDFAIDRPLRAHPSTQLGHFGWDLRQLRPALPRLAAALPPDPCDLVFHRVSTGPTVFIRRVDALTATALAAILESDGGSAREVSGGRPRVINRLSRLHAEGALEWA